MKARHLTLASPRVASSSTAGWGWRAGVVTAALWSAVLAFWPWEARGADRSPVERGKYLVTLGSCGDCHMPAYFLGKPDLTRQLAGSGVGFEIPGVFHGPNLTPDMRCSDLGCAGCRGD